MSLMCRIAKSLWRKGKTAIIDIGFCVLRVLVGMFERVICGSALEKKCIYWLTGIYGYGINAHFEPRKR